MITYYILYVFFMPPRTSVWKKYNSLASCKTAYLIKVKELKEQHITYGISCLRAETK